MEIRVFVVCQACHRVRELVVDGPDVVVNLSHDCDAEGGAFETRLASAPPADSQLTLAS